MTFQIVGDLSLNAQNVVLKQTVDGVAQTPSPAVALGTAKSGTVTLTSPLLAHPPTTESWVLTPVIDQLDDRRLRDHPDGWP